jgi:O-acetyl-ADP-ribose deacetylase (regulator of RNase III)
MAQLRRDHPRGTPTGTAVTTTAGELPARWVIHAVGPVWRGGAAGEPEQLASAYRSALGEAEAAGARTVALPAISAGIYGYPLHDAAAVGLRTVAEHLRAAASVRRATFVLFSRETFEVFAEELGRLELS